jgi:flagellin
VYIMAISFNSNIAALQSIRVQQSTSNGLARTFERLSTGLRINRASDDAASLAVASGLNNESRVLGRAVRNINDGISALQIADATYSAANVLLTRMGELATQGAAGIFSGTQRIALNKEYAQLDAELRRLSKQTTFNGIQLTEGTAAARTNTLLYSTNPDEIYGVSADGRYVVFRTNNLLRRLDNVTGQVSNITNITGTYGGVQVSAGGNIIAFGANSNLTGENAGGFSQVFVVDATTGVTKQVTTNSDATLFNSVSALSADGSTVGYSIENSSNGAFSLYAYRQDTNITKQVLAPQIPFVESSYVMAISSDGSQIAAAVAWESYTSGAKLYRFDNNTSSLTTLYNQDDYGQGAFNFRELAISNQGRVYFVASEDINNLNPNASENIWSILTPISELADIANISIIGTASSTATLGQLSLTADESALVFLSNGVYGTNTTGRLQAFRYEIDSGTFTQQTNYTNNSLLTATAILASDGNSVVYRSSGIRQYDTSLQSTSLNIELGSNAAGSISTSIGSLNGTLRGIGATTIGSQYAARAAIDLVNRNIELLSLARSAIGSGLSRLETGLRVVSNRELEVTAARGRIIDADFASESAEMVRMQILQNTSTALLAQSKLAPQIGLKLLEGAAAFAPGI